MVSPDRPGWLRFAPSAGRGTKDRSRGSGRSARPFGFDGSPGIQGWRIHVQDPKVEVVPERLLDKGGEVLAGSVRRAHRAACPFPRQLSASASESVSVSVSATLAGPESDCPPVWPLFPALHATIANKITLDPIEDPHVYSRSTTLARAVPPGECWHLLRIFSTSIANNAFPTPLWYRYTGS